MIHKGLAEFKLPPKEYTIEIEVPGYEKKTLKVKLNTHKTILVRLRKLKPKEEAGTYTVTVKVYKYGTNKPVSSGTVKVYSGYNGTKLVASKQLSNGVATFNLKGGIYTFEVSAEGYVTAKRSLAVESDKIIMFYLKPKEVKVTVSNPKLSVKYLYKSAEYNYVLGWSVTVNYNNPSSKNVYVPVTIYMYDQSTGKWKSVQMTHVLVRPGSGTATQTGNITVSLPGTYRFKANVGGLWTNEVTVTVEKPVERMKVTKLELSLGAYTKSAGLYAVPTTVKIYYEGKLGTVKLSYYVNGNYFMGVNLDLSGREPVQPITVRKILYLKSPGTYRIKVCAGTVCSNEVTITIT